MGVACRQCGNRLRRAAKFCDECGAAVSQAANTAEYKQVTILFADVVHSMDIAAAVGPERLREVMSELFDRCHAAVQRYGGTVEKFTGDGIMAVFGAPMSLEDHAIRACLAALDTQAAADDLAVELRRRDGIDLRLRVGLNSGEVIVGDVGSRVHSYATVGAHVGFAQRMESVAPPGGVMVSESTARLVANAAVLGEPLQVRIKGADTPVPARMLMSMKVRRGEAAQRMSTLVGRNWEVMALAKLLDRAVGGHGSVANVVGPPGIGKSRMVAEVTTVAESIGAQVYSTYCESHTSDVPFQAATRLLRSAFGVDGLTDDAARARVRSQVPEAECPDLVLLHDELGIRLPTEQLPDIAPEARRRRLTALVNAAALARTTAALYVVEDAHWIDATSESLLADFLSVIPQTRALVLITYRPEYKGALGRGPAAQTIALARLDDVQTADLVTELLGPHPSVEAVARRVVERAAGNPFFAEEIVRDLAARGVLSGEMGSYRCADETTDVDVPPTLQAAIASRIDRLGPRAKLTLNAAAVIGLRFEESMLRTLIDNAALAALVEAELIDQVKLSPNAVFAFRHPLIRAVAYRSQLNSARAELHRQLVAVIASSEPTLADENAALVAEHLEAAGDLREAFGWHMRAGAWLTFRDVKAARLSWQRAGHVADRLPVDDPHRTEMCIGPRTLRCASAFRVSGAIDEAGFDELRRLAASAGDKTSLAAALAGHILVLSFHARHSESSRLASELMELIEALGEPALMISLLPAAINAKLANGNVVEALRLGERAVDLCDGDPHIGNFVVESPLAIVSVLRAVARMCLGVSGWQTDLAHATDLCLKFLPIGQPIILFWKYFGGLAGAFALDAEAVRDTAEMLERAEQRGDDLTLESARFLHGIVLAQQDGPDRDSGLTLLARAREAAIQQRSLQVFVPMIDIEFSKEKVRTGDVDEAIKTLRAVVVKNSRNASITGIGRALETLVETLLRRAEHGDLEAAGAAIEQLVTLPTDTGFVMHEIAALRLRGLLARSSGDSAGYRHYVNQYRYMAKRVGFDGHIAMAAAMT